MNNPSSISHRPMVPLTLIMAVFTCTFFFYRDFGYRMIYGYAMLGLLLAVHMLDRLRRDVPPRFTCASLTALVLAGVIVLHFLRPAARRDVDTLSYLISMLICMGYVLFAPAEAESVCRAGAVMYVSAMAMGTFVVVFTLLPGLFLQTVYPLLSGVAQRYYDFFSPLGYGVSLGTYSYTDYVLYLGMAVCCADLAVKPRTAKCIAGNTLSIGFLLVSMVVLGRRGELLAAAAAIAVLVLALCSRRKRHIIIAAGSAALLVGITLILLFLPQLKQITVLARYVETIEQILSGADFTSGRGPLLALALQGFLSKPIFGLGWGQYIQLSALIGMCDTDGNLIEDCHNIYLQFLCETGIVGTVLLLIPICCLFVTTCRTLRAVKTMEDKIPLRFVSVSFLLQFFLLFLGLYDPSFQKIVFWCFYALALMFLNAALVRGRMVPDGPVIRVLTTTANKLVPAAQRLWSLLRTPWKEGKE